MSQLINTYWYTHWEPTKAQSNGVNLALGIHNSRLIKLYSTRFLMLLSIKSLKKIKHLVILALILMNNIIANSLYLIFPLHLRKDNGV